MGLFHATAGLIFLDQTLMAVKKRFVGLHESGHGFMPWQRPMYAVVKDCEKPLDPEAPELFDREANVFASEVLFKLDTFRDMAESRPFEIWTPVRLAKTFDASIYASIRQYVIKNHRACAVIVLNMPELIEGHGSRATLRPPFNRFHSPECSGLIRGSRTTHPTTISARSFHSERCARLEKDRSHSSTATAAATSASASRSHS
jgi:hypothetical protein